jgi:hypothetical protein
LRYSILNQVTLTAHALLLLLRRLTAAGWRDCQLLTEKQLTAKYGVEHAQPILVGSV